MLYSHQLSPILGHSLGGIVAQTITAKYPDKINRYYVTLLKNLIENSHKKPRKNSIMFIKQSQKIIFLLLVLSSSIAWAQSNLTDKAATQLEQQCSFNGVNYTATTDVVKKLQTAVKQGDKKEVAQLISFPLRINKLIKGKMVSLYVKDATSFINQYNTIITDNMKQRILMADPRDIFCNYQGAMISNGDVWFKQSKDNSSIKIFSMFIVQNRPLHRFFTQ